MTIANKGAKMKKIENDCVDCGFPCIGNACRFYEVTRYYCDECGNEDKLYDTDFGELCESCLLKKFSVVKGSDY